MSESVRVTKSGYYVEETGNGVWVTKSGYYVELDNGELRVTQSGYYAELLPEPPTSHFVTGQTGLRVYYDNKPIGAYIQSFSLENNVKINDPSVFNNTGLAQPGLSMWVASMSGIWGVGLDDIFGAEVVARGSSSTMYNFRVDMGVPGDQVSLSWLAAAFVTRYKPKANVDNAFDYDAVIALSGSPVRSTSH